MNSFFAYNENNLMTQKKEVRARAKKERKKEGERD
jgi:hypothetical protein